MICKSCLPPQRYLTTSYDKDQSFRDFRTKVWLMGLLPYLTEWEEHHLLKQKQHLFEHSRILKRALWIYPTIQKTHKHGFFCEGPYWHGVPRPIILSPPPCWCHYSWQVSKQRSMVLPLGRKTWKWTVAGTNRIIEVRNTSAPEEQDMDRACTEAECIRSYEKTGNLLTLPSLTESEE